MQLVYFTIAIEILKNLRLICLPNNIISHKLLLSGDNGGRGASECTRRTSSTFLFAYSTDSDQYDVDSVLSDLVGTDFAVYGYSTVANVRFDVKQEEQIQYHSDASSFNASVCAHPANSTIGYGDTTTGSDIFRVIQKFLNNDQATICGSAIYVLVKRYPNEEDIEDLITQLRDNHVFVYFIVHDSPSGGTVTQSLFKMSSRTNGFCIFVDASAYWMVAFDGTHIKYDPNQFLAQNYLVSGSGSLELPTFKTPIPFLTERQQMIVVTVQDHKQDNNFVSLTYQISTLDGTVAYPTAKNDWWDRYGTGIIAFPYLNGTVDYKMTINYNYLTNQQQVIEVRMFSGWYHDFVPFASN